MKNEANKVIVAEERKRLTLKKIGLKKKAHYALMFVDLANVTGPKRFNMWGEKHVDAEDGPMIFANIEDFNWAGLLLKHLDPSQGVIFPVKPIVYTDVSREKSNITDLIPSSFKIVFYKKSNADIVMATDIISLGRDLLEFAGKIDLEITLKVFSGDYDFIYPLTKLTEKAQGVGVPVNIEVFAWKGSISRGWKDAIPSSKTTLLNYCPDYFSSSMQERVRKWNEDVKRYEKEHQENNNRVHISSSQD